MENEKKIVIEVEFGQNLKESINRVIESVKKLNRDPDITTIIHPGKEIREAFGIDINDMVRNAIVYYKIIINRG